MYVRCARKNPKYTTPTIDSADHCSMRSVRFRTIGTSVSAAMAHTGTTRKYCRAASPKNAVAFAATIAAYTRTTKAGSWYSPVTRANSRNDHADISVTNTAQPIGPSHSATKIGGSSTNQVRYGCQAARKRSTSSSSPTPRKTAVPTTV